MHELHDTRFTHRRRIDRGPANRDDRRDHNRQPDGDDDKKKGEEYREAWRRLNERHKRRATPWLLIRYTLADLGLRPIPAGDAFWVSPDIWVESSDPFGNAVAGEENFVHARVFNLGKTTSAPTRVDFYWADPSLGLGPGNFNLIGTEWVEVFEHTAKYVRCNTPWIPLFLNNGHECLMVHCSNPILDPLMQPFQPRLDRHVGQRNITVLKGKAGDKVKFAISLNNLFPITTRTLVTARIEHLAFTAGKLTRMAFPQVVDYVIAHGKLQTNTPAEMMRRFNPNTAEFRMAIKMAQVAANRAPAEEAFENITTRAAYASSAACINSTFDDHACVVGHQGGRKFIGDLLSAMDKLSPAAQLVDASRDLVLHELTLANSEQRRLVIELGLPGDTRRNEFVVVHLTQKTEGLILGGYTIVAHVGGPLTRDANRMHEQHGD